MIMFYFGKDWIYICIPFAYYEQEVDLQNEQTLSMTVESITDNNN